MRAMWSVGFILSGSALFLLIGILVFSTREPLHAPLQGARTPVEELQKDADDLGALIKASRRPQIKGLLVSLEKRLERQIHRQEELIVEGNRVSEAALRHLENKEYSQSKLELSAAKSAYQRAAALDKVQWIEGLEVKLMDAEEQREAQPVLNIGGLLDGDARLPQVRESHKAAGEGVQHSEVSTSKAVEAAEQDSQFGGSNVDEKLGQGILRDKTQSFRAAAQVQNRSQEIDVNRTALMHNPSGVPNHGG